MDGELPNLNYECASCCPNPCISASDWNHMGGFVPILRLDAIELIASRRKVWFIWIHHHPKIFVLDRPNGNSPKMVHSTQPTTWPILFAASSFLFPFFTWKICFSLFSFAHLSLSLSSSCFRSLLNVAKLTSLPTSLAASSKSVIVTAEVIPLSFLPCFVIAFTARSKTCQPARPSREVRRDEVPV